MRLVLDTNVVVSALLWQGTPRQLLRLAIAGEVTLFTSPALLRELSGILDRRKFAAQLTRQPYSKEALVLRYSSVTRVVAPREVEPVILSDPDDDHVLACAISGRVDRIVSGDSHLVALKSFRNIPIVLPSTALDAVMPKK